MFWNNYANFNPAMSGFEDQQHAAATYIDYYPGLAGTFNGLYANGNVRLAEKHGVGITYSGNYFPLMTNAASVNYNYQFDLKKAGKLSAGMSAGAGRTQVKKEYLDDYIFANSEPQNTFLLTIGAAYKWKNVLIGVSSTNLTSPSSPPSGFGSQIGLNAHTSYEVKIGEKFQLIPQALFTSLDGFQNLKFNTTAVYSERFSVGVSIQNRDNFGFNLGWDILRKFRVAYGFNQTFSKLSNGVSGGIHEFSIGYLLKN